ncbi:MAG: glycosyltransferase family 4 protein [Clostridia bacterium]|nr:glycosyltransferase family 4 protein [Clostridia bacterium]
MARILILCNSSGGLYDFRDRLLQELAKEHELVISMPDDLKVSELKALPSRIINTPMDRHGMRPAKEYRLMRTYRDMMEEVKPDLVLAYTIKPVVYGGMAARKLRIPFIPTVTGLSDGFFSSAAVRKMTAMLYKAGLKKARCVFFQNQANLDFFSYNGIYKGKTVLVSGSGVNLERFSPLPYPEDDIIKLLYINRIKKEKGFMEFLETARHFRQLQDEGKIEIAPRFIVLGYSEDDLSKLVEKENEAGTIEYAGFSTEVEKYYAMASAVVVPSYHEGMSNVLMEASAMARPVLASAVPGCRDIVEDGKTGFTFAAKDAAALTKAVEKFIRLSRDERKAMGEAARRKMEWEFDRNTVTAAYLEEINSVLSERKNNGSV